MAAAQDVVKDADSRRLFSFSRPIVMLSWLPWHGGREDACGHSAVKETRAESCHPDTADRFPPDSAQVDHDRSHHLHLACALSVLSLFSVLRKGSRGTAPQGRPEKRREKLSTRGLCEHTFWLYTGAVRLKIQKNTELCSLVSCYSGSSTLGIVVGCVLILRHIIQPEPCGISFLQSHLTRPVCLLPLSRTGR